MPTNHMWKGADPILIAREIVLKNSIDTNMPFLRPKTILEKISKEEEMD